MNINEENYWSLKSIKKKLKIILIYCINNFFILKNVNL